MLRSIQYGSETIRFEIIHRPARQTLSIEVHPGRRVVVLAPSSCTEAIIGDRVRRRADWILRQLDAFGRYEPRTPRRHFVSGETHLYLGRRLRLKVTNGTDTGVHADRNHLTVTLTGNRTPLLVRRALDNWYQRQALVIFHRVVAERAELGRFTPLPRIVVRRLRSRWGSMSRAGTMTLNVALIQTPRSCIEYVVTHELCHIRHRHHRASFYRLLKRTMPDWEKRKHRLEAALL